jgi:hypothetical protein
MKDFLGRSWAWYAGELQEGSSWLLCPLSSVDDLKGFLDKQQEARRFGLELTIRHGHVFIRKLYVSIPPQ